ncbi:TPA: hypothetical protein ACH4ZF_003260 [Escherichia coli]
MGGIPPACLSLEARDYYKRQQSAIYHNPLAWIIFIGIPHKDEVALEEAACPLVTTILKENNGSTAPKCMKVTIEDKVTDKFYRATATLDNGNDINITLELTGDRNFYVRVPNVYLNN